MQGKIDPFYGSVNWRVLSPKIATIVGHSYEHIVMLYDPNSIATVDESTNFNKSIKGFSK